MRGVPVWVWVLIGIGGLFAYSLGHRHGAVLASAKRETQEASTPLQEFVQPQPASSYGMSPYESQLVYSAPQGAFQ